MGRFTEFLNEGMENLTTRGAFLTTKEGDRVNAMTISWGNVGFEWKRPVFITMVRESRFSKISLDKTGEFTVTIPLDGTMKSAIGICGSKSGRDIDKIKECNLELQNSNKTDVPSIKCASIVIECRVIYKQKLDLDNFADGFKEEFYSDNDIHTMYYGEILDIYKV